MPRPIRATVHSEALAHNLALARRAAGNAKVWAVVKADAYGHGIERVFDALRAADGFALLDLAEAQRVRALGWRGPILLLEGAFELRDLERCSRLDLWHVVHCTEQIDMLANPQNPGAAPGVSEDEFRHEPPGPAARSLPGGLDAVERVAPGR
jgi:alanine racemase